MTKGRVTPAPGVRVRIGDLLYWITQADAPTELDDVTCVTEVDVQPAGGGAMPSSPIINAELVGTEEISYGSI